MKFALMFANRYQNLQSNKIIKLNLAQFPDLIKLIVQLKNLNAIYSFNVPLNCIIANYNRYKK